MEILKNVTGGIHPGEMMIFSSGRRTGKSYYNQMLMDQTQSYKDITHATVDDYEWYTVKCNKETAAWVRQQNKDMWYEHIDSNWTIYKNMFDMHEKIYTMMLLKYGHDRV
jgi:hypothetical protein